MASYMLGEMGLAGLSTLANYSTSKSQYNMQKALTESQNRLNNLNAAMQMNSINRNKITAAKQVQLSEAQDQITAIQTKGAMQNSAATAGAYGNSVASTLSQVGREQAMRKYNRNESWEATQLDLHDQTRQVLINQAMGTKTNVSTAPTLGNAMLSYSTQLLDIWKSHNPKGNSGIS